MKNKTKKQEIPKSFKGTIYKEGEEVVNPFSGQCYTLNGLELSIYDFIIGSQHIFEVAPRSVTPKQVNQFQKALNWFRRNNVEAYMVLLD